MLRNKILLSFTAMALLAIGNIYSQAKGKFDASSFNLVDRYLQKSEESYEDGNLEDAYKQITMAMKVSKVTESDVVPANIIVFARTIYRNRLNQLQNKYDEAAFIDIKENVATYSEIVTPEITKLIKQIESQAIAREKEADKRHQQEFLKSQKSATDALGKAIEESTKITQDAVNEMAKATQSTQDAVSEMAKTTSGLVDSQKDTNKKFTMMIFLIIGIFVVILIVVMLIILIVRAAAKHSKVQQEQYVEAFKLLAQNQSQTNQLMIGGIAGLYGDEGLKLAGSSTWTQSSLPAPEETPEEKEELRELAAKCEDLGAKIDQATGRKNNSKNVSELVFKLSTQLGVTQHEAMVYFCAAMVYDAGFLSIDEELLAAENLTDEQRQELNKHVELYEEHLMFVPRRYWQVFEDAALYHHENMDGSGMHGKSGDEIPKIARIIRVADSFNALSSRRTYRSGTDKETALEKLEEQPEIYDQDVINALKEII